MVLGFVKILSFDRFDGIAPEPRKGIRSGHVPGSKCIPFAQVQHIIKSIISIQVIHSYLNSYQVVLISLISLLLLRTLEYIVTLCVYVIARLFYQMPNVFYLQMLDGSQTLLPADELKKRFDQEGLNIFLQILVLLSYLVLEFYRHMFPLTCRHLFGKSGCDFVWNRSNCMHSCIGISVSSLIFSIENCKLLIYVWACLGKQLNLQFIL